MAQNGLLDILQGASNAAASNISAPVDGLAWLLRKAGLPIPDAPIGGSDWMASKGLTAKPQNYLAGLLGESVGGVAPIVAAAKAPQIARGLLQVEANAMAPTTLRPEAGAIVWHGSPHKFDRFDSSKIGTGEGAQAYGHGLYLAESPGVAKGYKDTLAYKAFDLKPEAEARGLSLSAGARGEFIRQAQANIDPAIAARRLQNANISARGLPQDKLADLFAVYQKEGGGQLYKVDLPDNMIARMLDWDKALSQQAPEVREAMRKAGVSLADAAAVDAAKVGSDAAFDAWIAAQKAGRPAMEVNALKMQFQSAQIAHDAAKEAIGMTGQQAYRKAHEAAIRSGKALPAAEKERQAVDAMRRAGIPGIRYLDGGSRGTGAGTSNFVVFPGEENALRILERNGLLAP
tara:strand:+ start:42 stop:1250 length:1209 start_codon:yes stop_codon:yes gene_type:complete